MLRSVLRGLPLQPGDCDLWHAVALEGVKKQTCSDWDRRKRRREEEGADPVKPPAGLISSDAHAADVLYNYLPKEELEMS